MHDGSIGQRAHVKGEHLALSAWDADMLAVKMVKHAAANGGWHHLPDHLAELRAVVANTQPEAA